MKIITFGPAQQTPVVTLFFHGFPGVRSKQNLEIAESVSRITGQTTLVLLYSGLGLATGRFGFQSCMDEVLEWFGHNAARLGQVNLVGHSWGGFLSLSIAKRWPERVRKLTLLSPLLKFAGEELAEPSFAQTAKTNEQLVLSPSAELAADFARVGEANDASLLAEGVSEHTETLLMQANVDEITPPHFSQALVSHFRRAPTYELAENDHSFLANRAELSDRIARFLLG